MDSISFGDRVRIRTSAATSSRGVAEKIGIVYGRTTPSVTGVEVVGEGPGDEVVAVQLDGQPDAIWLYPDLLELVDHSPGMTASLGGKRFIRAENGEWTEITET